MAFQEVIIALKKFGNPEKKQVLQGFFKTGPGEYGEGDVFLGVKVPEVRSVAKKFGTIPFSDVKKLLMNEVHEVRLCALLILVHQYETGDETVRRKIVDFYLKHTVYINNWDLVDLTAHKILGEWLVDKDRSVLYKLARSSSLWERRMSIVSTFAFIHRGDFDDSFALAELLLDDNHDLMHKAVGWVLREVGKKDEGLLRTFLDRFGSSMPRTALRYSIERLPDRKRILEKTKK